MTSRLQIVGHGLAGAVLAETASAAGFDVRVRDDGGPAGSRVAAGLFTPLTGKKLTPSWRLEDALPHLETFYPALERRLDASFFHPLPHLRIFRTRTQREEWDRREAVPYAEPADLADCPFHAPHGGLRMRHTGWVDLPVMLDALQTRRQIRNEWGSWDDEDVLTVWAEGVRAQANPLWRDVGWRVAHGDILTLHIPDLPEDRIFNFGRFLLPIGNHRFRCGATYTWNRDTPAPRKEGRRELEADLRDMLRLPFEVVDHQAGLRPVALARVPVAGPHPEHPQHWIFNGLASKGVLYAPWMAERLIEALRGERELPKETRAARRIQRQRDRDATARGQARARRTHT